MNPTCLPRRVVPALLVALLLTAPLAAAFPVADVDPVAEKADAALLAALDRAGAGAVPLSVIVLGPPHAAFDGDAFATRADALSWLDAQAAPFVDGVGGLVARLGGDVVQAWPAGPAVKVLAPPAALAALAARDDVRALTLDREDGVRLVEPIEEPETPRASNRQARKMIQAEEMWALGFRGAGATIAVIDTGIDGTHEAFRDADGSSRIAAFADCQSGGCAVVVPYDDHGHGTHVAGTAAGSDKFVDPVHGAFQEVGIAPEATLVGVKFLSSSGSGSFQGAMDALSWAYAQGADVASNSWGSSCSSSVLPVMSLVRTLTDGGMVSVFAAGNGGPNPGTVGGPACSESAITVGSVDANATIASSSARGPCSDIEIGGPARVCPDLVMKGREVRSAIPRAGASNGDPSGYKTWSGTSMATPSVAGGVALIEQMKRALTGSGWNTTARQEEEVLKATALDLGPPGPDDAYGWGLPQLLNVHALVDASDEARIVHTFTAPPSELRLGQSAPLTFSVRNLGGAVATGEFVATLTHPDGSTETLRAAMVALGLLDEARHASTFRVAGDIAPGEYVFAGSFAYAWTNATTGVTETGLVAESAAFEVRRVFMDVSVDGVDDDAPPLVPQQVAVRVENVGNDAAHNVRLEITFTDRYAPLPGDGFDPSDANSRYASPAPDEVREDRNFGRVTLAYALGELAPGETFDASMTLAPTTPGDYSVLVVVKFCDVGGTCASQGQLARQRVAAPTP